MDFFVCAQSMWTYNEAAIELVVAVFIKRLQQHGHEFREENNLLAKEIHGNDKRYRLLVHLVLNGLREAPVRVYIDPVNAMFFLSVFEHIFGK